MYKVALIGICLNKQYWPYWDPMVESAKKYFLKNHMVDFFVWSDMPESKSGTAIIPTEPYQWPLPTLFRYSLFLKEEEKLKDYDYIFYVDADMKFVSRVGDEILGEGLTATAHPMYYLRRMYIPPYEPNKDSEAYIKMPGRVIERNGKKQFEPFYAAGGFQGGRADKFIEAMKEMKDMVDKDFKNNYIPIWNDESIWNKYLFNHPPSVYLNPSYVYPDSLIKSYYLKIWGQNFVPKLMTLTKPFSFSPEGGVNINRTIATL